MLNRLKRILGIRELTADEIAIRRHRKLATAVPFPPELNWSDDDQSDRSLNRLYIYAEDLGLSAIDWYLKKKLFKKVMSIALRYASYWFVVLGAAFPLVKIFNVEALRDMFGPIASDLSSISVEAALVLIGIAGGLHAIDGLVGASSGWRRYIAAAMQLSHRLLTFRFQWNELVGEEKLGPPASEDSNGGDGPQTRLSLMQRKFELLRNFCLGVTEIVHQEATEWAAEFSDSVAQFEKQLPATHVLRPRGRS